MAQPAQGNSHGRMELARRDRMSVLRISLGLEMGLELSCRPPFHPKTPDPDPVLGPE